MQPVRTFYLLLIAIMLTDIVGAQQQTPRSANIHDGKRRHIRAAKTGSRKRLGQVKIDNAVIRNAAYQKGRVVSRVGKETYLVISGQMENDYKVLMANGSKGYIPKENLQLVDYIIVPSTYKVKR